MADRSLRGMRLGSQSLQSEEGVEFASRRKSIYRTEDGKTFDVVVLVRRRDPRGLGVPHVPARRAASSATTATS